MEPLVNALGLERDQSPAFPPKTPQHLCTPQMLIVTDSCRCHRNDGGGGGGGAAVQDAGLEGRRAGPPLNGQHVPTAEVRFSKLKYIFNCSRGGGGNAAARGAGRKAQSLRQGATIFS